MVRGAARLWWVVLLGQVMAAQAGESELTIVEDGRSSYTIIRAPCSPAATKLAAAELQSFIKETTGVRLPVEDERKNGTPAIVLRNDSSLPIESFLLEVRDKDLIISGHDTVGDPQFIDFEDPVSCGTLSGVYEVLERFLGVRFYWPDELGVITPRKERFVVPAHLKDKEGPRFSLRRLRYGPGYVDNRAEAATRTWGRRLRLGASRAYKFYHAEYKILDVAEWGRRGHPEYAALINGKRKPSYQAKHLPRHRNGHVCTTNPDVIKIFAEAAKQSADKMFSLSPNDGVGGFCECDRCTALDSGRTLKAGRFAGKRDLSDRIITFYNAVADAADRDVGGYAYHEYIMVPAHTKPHPHVYICVAPNNAWWAGREELQKRTERLYREWGAYSPRTTAYDIFFLGIKSPNLIAPLLDGVDRHIKTMADAGLAGAQLYIAPTMELGGPDAYVAAKLLWNPELDGDKLREMYYRDLYGPAWRTVQQLYEDAAEQWRETTAEFRFKGNLKRSYRKVVPVLTRHLEKAEREVGGDAQVRVRLARLRLAVKGITARR